MLPSMDLGLCPRPRQAMPHTASVATSRTYPCLVSEAGSTFQTLLRPTSANLRSTLYERLRLMCDIVEGWLTLFGHVECDMRPRAS